MKIQLSYLLVSSAPFFLSILKDDFQLLINHLAPHCLQELTIYSIIMPLKYHVFQNIMENGAFAPFEKGANVLFSLIFSKVFKFLLSLFLDFFNVV